MKALYLLMTVFFAGAISPANLTFAQSEPVKVKFVVDSKESNQPFKIMLSVTGGAIFEPSITDNSFVLPPELRNAEWIQLRFISGKYDLDYEDVHISKFGGEMIFGVDNAPFEEDRLKTIFGVDDEGRLNSNPDPNKELIFIYYLGTGTVCQTISVYK